VARELVSNCPWMFVLNQTLADWCLWVRLGAFFCQPDCFHQRWWDHCKSTETGWIFNHQIILVGKISWRVINKSIVQRWWVFRVLDCIERAVLLYSVVNKLIRYSGSIPVRFPREYILHRDSVRIWYKNRTLSKHLTKVIVTSLSRNVPEECRIVKSAERWKINMP